MTCFIKSDVVLDGNRIRYQTEEGENEIFGNTMVWIYIRKKAGKGKHHFYSLAEVERSTVGDLIIIDEKKNQYVFCGEFLKRPAGSIFADMLECWPACLAGCSQEDRKNRNLKERIRSCQILRQIYGTDT